MMELIKLIKLQESLNETLEVSFLSGEIEFNMCNRIQ